MTAIKLPVAELKPALVGLGKLINKRPTLPVLGTVVINRDQDGWITLTGTDLDSFATVRLEQPDEGKPETLLVPHQALTKLVKDCNIRDVIEIEHASNDRVLAHYPIGQQTANLHIESVPLAEFPPIPRIEGKTVNVEDGMRSAILEAMECASTDETRFVLNGAFLDVSQKSGHYVVATDGKHLYSSNSFNLPIKDSIVIPDHKFIGWKGFSDDGGWQMSVQPASKKDALTLVQLSSRRWKFITKVVEGNYPNWRQVIPDTSAVKTTVEFSPEVIDSVLKLIPKIPCNDPVNQPIALKIENKKLILRGRGKDDSDWTGVEVVGVTVKGIPVTVSLNRNLLTKALQFGLNEIGITDPTSPLRFSNGGRQMIIMPIRTDGPSTPAPVEAGKQNPEAQASPQPETERKTMPKPINTDGNGTPATTKPSLETAVEEIEATRDSLKTALGSMTTLLGTLKAVQREHKTADKEVQAVRQTLEKLQSVRF